MIKCGGTRDVSLGAESAPAGEVGELVPLQRNTLGGNLTPSDSAIQDLLLLEGCNQQMVVVCAGFTFFSLMSSSSSSSPASSGKSLILFSSSALGAETL